MIPVLEDANSRRLVVLAHPDDETLWCGGLILRYPGNWTCVCCSQPTRDPIRAFKFYDACDSLGAVGHVVPFGETYKYPLNLSLLEKVVDLTGFDLVVTHGPLGEYGHPHHKQVHTYVTKRVSGQVMHIGYGAYKGQCDIEINLTNDEYYSKIAALKFYDNMINWGGKLRPTWDALLEEYGTPGNRHWGFDLRRETYYRVK